VLCQLSYAPGLGDECSLVSVQRRALGILFAALALALGAIGLLSALTGGRAWVVAVTAVGLALWLADLARRSLR
jgi:hypothetical protein